MPVLPTYPANLGQALGVESTDANALKAALFDLLRTHFGGTPPPVVNVRDPKYAGGAKGDGTTDDTAAIQAALDAARDAVVFVPPGTYRYSTTLLLPQGTVLRGAGIGDTLTNATVLNYYGADGTNGMQMTSASLSRVSIEGIRLVDARTAPTSGWGIYLDRAKNYVRIHNCRLMAFPSGSYYVGAATSSTECIHLSDLWCGVNGIGVKVESFDNNVILDHIMGDSTSTNTMTALIYVDNSFAGQGVISIRSAKLETDNGCHVLQVGSGFASTLVAESLVMRGPTAAAGGDVVRIGSTGGAYVLSGIGTARVSGGAAVAANLVNDTAATVVYGANKRVLPFLVLDKASSAPSGVVGTFTTTIKTKAGAPSDSDFSPTPADGALALDTTNHRLYVRDGGSWKYAALT